MEIRPIARNENIVVQDLEKETLVCDLATNRVFCLNTTAGEVWKLCDGQNEVKQIAQILSRKLKTEVSPEMVLIALDKLSKKDLLAEKTDARILFTGLSRREAARRAGLTTLLALPVIFSVAMPAAVQAASGAVGCSDDAQCPANQFCNFAAGAVCAPDLSPGIACSRNAQCLSGNCNVVCCCSSTSCGLFCLPGNGVCAVPLSVCP